MATVGVPVSDHDRAVDFYVGVLGMERRVDVPTPGGGRWLVVAPLGAIGLVVAHDDVPAGVETGIRLTTPDAAHTQLLSRGVEAGELLRWSGVAPMFAFRDRDGNGLELIEAAGPWA